MLGFKAPGLPGKSFSEIQLRIAQMDDEEVCSDLCCYHVIYERPFNANNPTSRVWDA